MPPENNFMKLLIVAGITSTASMSQVSGAQEAATASARGSSMLEEVTVTARKRDESLSDISAAVSVISGDRLRQSNINDIKDLQVVVPAVTVGEVVGIMRTSIRGLGNTTNLRGEDSEVTFHVDGAPISRQEFHSMAFFDLERIEVLRGPQGTLFGRNSTGGMLNLITAKPTMEREGYLNISLGNYDYRKTDAAVSGPISDNLLGRVALQTISRKGFGENVVTGNDIDDENRWAGRVHLDYKINEDANLLLTAEYASQDDASGLLTYYGEQFPENQDNPSLTAFGSGGFTDPDSRSGAGDFDPQMEKETYSITATLEWNLSDEFILKNVLNYRDMDFWLGQDLDLSSVVSSPATNGFPTTAVGVTYQDEHFSNEIQLVHEGEVLGNHLSGILGFFYYDESLDGTTSIGLTPTQDARAELIGKMETEAWAPFFNVSYDVTEEITARIGGRYTREERSIDNDLYVPPADLLLTDFASDDEREFEEYTGEYGLDYRFNDDWLLYYTFSQGFRSGAALIGQLDNPIAAPTTVDNHEVGLKAELLDGRLNLGLSLYDAEISDLQRTQLIPDPNAASGSSVRVRNAASLSTQGVEFEFGWLVNDRARLSGTVNYIDAQFEDFVSQDPLLPNSVTGPFIPVQVEGNRPRLIPEWKGNINGEYDVPLKNGGLITLRGDLSYVGDQYFDEFNREPFYEDDYLMVNGSVIYYPSEGSWNVSLWGKNLSDEKRIADTSFSATGRVLSKVYTKPLTWGVTLNIDF